MGSPFDPPIVKGIGTQEDAAATSDTGAFSLISLIKRLLGFFSNNATVDKSGTIAAGGTAQVMAAANTSRKGFWIQNASTGDLWINTLATAVQSSPSMKIAAGQIYETPLNGCPTGAVSVIGAVTGQAFTAREW